MNPKSSSVLTCFFCLCALPFIYAEPYPLPVPLPLALTQASSQTARSSNSTSSTSSATATVPSIPPECKKLCDPPIAQASACFSSGATGLNMEVLKCLCTKADFWKAAMSCNDCLMKAGVPEQFTTQADLQDKGEGFCEMLENPQTETKLGAANEGEVEKAAGGMLGANRLGVASVSVAVAMVMAA